MRIKKNWECKENEERERKEIILKKTKRKEKLREIKLWKKDQMENVIRHFMKWDMYEEKIGIDG